MTQAQPNKRARIAVLGTGGTIAMTADQDGGKVTLGAGALAEALGDLAEITTRDVLAQPSANFVLADLARIAAAAEEASDEFDGVVITHGTDTMEETAFALTLLLRTQTPVVLTGAMRRPDQPGADGPANLAAAIRVAASPAARGLGVLVAMDDEIHAGPWVRKVHSFRTHAFSSAPLGPIGWVAEDRVRIAFTPRQDWPRCARREGRAPVVPILEVGPGLNPIILDAFAQGIDGLVLSLPGAGHVAASALERLQRLAAGRPLVFATRTGGGETLRSSYGFPGGEMSLSAAGLIPGGPLDARKARILLELLLADNKTTEDVRATFASL